MTTKQIINKLNQLWQAKIKQKGLVKTGALLNSVQWVEDANGLHLNAEEYYVYLDEKYKISKEILNSKEFKDIVSTYYAQKLETNLKLSAEVKQLKK